MFGIMCAVISSAIFNFLSNRYGWATSSTHATIGALIGIAVASGSDVTWGYTLSYNKTTGALSGQNGLGAVLASFLISPALAGSIGAVVFTLVKVVVLDRKGVASFNWALLSLPFWYGFVVAFEGWLISWKSPRACSATQGPPCMTAYNDDQIM
jgi:sodium-dependent phosphate transporter